MTALRDTVRACILAALVTGSIVSFASAQPPTLSYSQPAAVAPGQSLDVTFYGGTLAGPTALWSNLPLTSELAPGIEGNGTAADHVVYRITVPADAQVGIGGVRIATGQGVSNLRLLMIDDLPSLADGGANKSIETAQEVALPAAIDGACEAESMDYYRFTAAAGQRISIEVFAQRLGSPLDPVIRVIDPTTGKELAYSDDEPGSGIDSRLAFNAPAAGQYIVEIRDIKFTGGGTHRYRMRIGNFPLVTAAFPLGAQRGTTSQLSVAGATSEFVSPLDVTMPTDIVANQVSVGAKFPAGQGSALVSVVASSLPETLEIEPNDSLEQSSAVLLPAAINGRLAAPRDRDYYVFEAKAGQRLVFTGKTRSLGSPTDLFLRLLNADGGVLLEAEDAGTEEGIIDYGFPADGVYRLLVEDLQRRGGSAHAYRIEVESHQPGFTLVLDAEKFDAPQGGVFVSKVVAARKDYNGPITLEVSGVDGCTLANNVIAEGQTEVVLSVTLPAGLPAGTLADVRIVGRARIGEVDFAAVASTIAPLRVAFSGLPYPPASLDGAVGLGVGPVFPEFFKLTADPVLLPQLVGGGTLTVKAEKLNGFADVINLAVEGLPEGVTATLQPVAADQPQVAIALAGGEILPEGDHVIRVTGSAVFQNQPRSVVLAEVPLKVIKPLGVAIVPAGPLVAGGTQKVKVTITRYGDDMGAVALTFKNLPTGVTATAGAAVPEGQTEVEIDLTAAADAVVGAVPNLAVEAAATVKGTAITVESAPVALDVTAQ